MAIVCARCGAPVGDGDRFCAKCGRPQGFKARPILQRTWWRVLIVGLILYGITAHMLASAGNPNLVPTVILLGAFAFVNPGWPTLMVGNGPPCMGE